jgi:hypothetical protein
LRIGGCGAGLENPPKIGRKNGLKTASGSLKKCFNFSLKLSIFSQELRRAKKASEGAKRVKNASQKYSFNFILRVKIYLCVVRPQRASPHGGSGETINFKKKLK